MLEITTKATEVYDDIDNKFIEIPSCTFTLEHSLISVAKWEAKWHIPYLSDAPRTKEQELDYIKCMVVGRLPSDIVFNSLTAVDIDRIVKYIEDPNTATTIKSNVRNTSKKEVLTVEQIYHRMFENNIPMECQKWHLNRLLTLIRVCNFYNSGANRKMNKADTAKRNAELNALRRAKYNTRG